MGKRPASAYMKDVNEKKGGIYGLKKNPPRPEWARSDEGEID
jgi:hypothetical protein